MTAFIGADLTQTYTSADLTGANSGKVPGVGDIYVDHNGKKYRFVRFDNGTGNVAAVAGNFCYYLVAGGTTVTSDLSDSVNIGAGMFMSAPADGEYCWIQTWGQATLNTALTAGADGNALTPVGSTDGTLDVSAAVTDHIAAVAIDISEKIVFITCP